MKDKILITDTLFIMPEHEQMIREAGFDIERLETATATEDQLIEHLQDKVGYILGGIEQVTDKVIESATNLKAIVFTGAGWKSYIPSHELATSKGIAIANTPKANTYAVAEYTLALILTMTRNLMELGRTGKTKFQTTSSLNELTVGIIGMGSIGSEVANMLNGLGVKKIWYYSPNRKDDIEQQTGAEFVDMDILLTESDIVTLHASQEAGNGFMGQAELAKMKDGALLINCGFTGGIDADALYAELSSGRLRATQDDPIDERFDSLPLSVWFNSNSHTAYNTFEANKTASDMATRSLLNLLATGDDTNKVN